VDKILEEKVGNEWNPIVYVDRTGRPAYPDFVKEVKHLKLELVGPTDFDVRKIELWLHSKQVNGCAIGTEIYEDLLTKKLLEGCLGFADLQVIQERGIGFFRKYFFGKSVFGWKSVVLDCRGRLNVPYLFEGGDEVELLWRWLDDDFYSHNPALRFAN